MSEEKLVAIIEYFDKEQRRSIQVDIPKDWGENVEEIAAKLTEKLNDENDVFLNMGNRIIKKIHVEGAVIKKILYS
jgi:hypothetical protein